MINKNKIILGLNLLIGFIWGSGDTDPKIGYQSFFENAATSGYYTLGPCREFAVLPRIALPELQWPNQRKKTSRLRVLGEVLPGDDVEAMIDDFIKHKMRPMQTASRVESNEEKAERFTTDDVYPKDGIYNICGRRFVITHEYTDPLPERYIPTFVPFPFSDGISYLPGYLQNGELYLCPIKQLFFPIKPLEKEPELDKKYLMLRVVNLPGEIVLQVASKMSVKEVRREIYKKVYEDGHPPQHVTTCQKSITLLLEGQILQDDDEIPYGPDCLEMVFVHNQAEMPHQIWEEIGKKVQSVWGKSPKAFTNVVAEILLKHFGALPLRLEQEVISGAASSSSDPAISAISPLNTAVTKETPAQSSAPTEEPAK